MTREEAISHIRLILSYDGSFDEYDAENLVNKIFDDFESRVCKNCKFFVMDNYGKYCEKFNGEDNPCDIREDFGCNRFERK